MCPSGLLDRDHGVLDVDDIVLLHAEKFLANFFSFGFRWKLDNDEIGHDRKLLPKGANSEPEIIAGAAKRHHTSWFGASLFS